MRSVCPRPVTVFTDGRVKLGPILMLAMEIAPVEHVGCACVRGWSWHCHGGFCRGDVLRTTRLDASDLVVKDVGADLWSDGMGNCQEAGFGAGVDSWAVYICWAV